MWTEHQNSQDTESNTLQKIYCDMCTTFIATGTCVYCGVTKSNFFTGVNVLPRLYQIWRDKPAGAKDPNAKKIASNYQWFSKLSLQHSDALPPPMKTSFTMKTHRPIVIYIYMYIYIIYIYTFISNIYIYSHNCQGSTKSRPLEPANVFQLSIRLD